MDASNPEEMTMEEFAKLLGYNESDESTSLIENTSFWDELYEKNKNRVPPVVVVTVCIQAFVAFIGLLANFTVIVVTVLGNNRQESSSITYVTNLSISNFVFLITVPFRLVEDTFLRWYFGEAFCQLATFIKHSNFSVVVLFLMVMSLDRYLAVNRAMVASHLRSKRVATFACIFVWLISLAGALPLAILHSVKNGMRCMPYFPDQTSVNISLILNRPPDQDSDASAATCAYQTESSTFTAWTLCNFFYSFFIPFVIIITCYCAIVRRVRRPSAIVNTKGKMHRVIRRKVTVMAAILVISYTVCYTPYYVWQVCRLIGIPVSHISVCFHVERFNTTMAYINSALHPIVYACTSGQFSLQFRIARSKIFCSKASSLYYSGNSKTTKSLVTKLTSLNGSKEGDHTKHPVVSDKRNSSIVTGQTDKEGEAAPLTPAPT